MPGSWGGESRLPDGPRWRALAAGAAGDVASMVDLCRRVRDEVAALDVPTGLRVLAALAEGSHAVARLVQCDQEAVGLLRAAGAPVPDAVLALFPPEPASVRACADDDGRWTVDGRQRRSTHAGAVTAAVLVAATDQGPRPFLVRLDAPGVVADDPDPPRLIAPEDPNRAVTFAAVDATPVATAAWWAARPPSALALLRDAACWFGACVWLCRALERGSVGAGAPDPAELVRAGRVDVWVHAARLALRSAVPSAVDDPAGPVAELAARRAVATIATTAETVIRALARESGGRMTGQDPLLGTRVAQLQIALRRFDGDGNLHAIGALLSAGTDPATVTE